MTALTSPAAERNKVHIEQVFKEYINPEEKVRILEIASGYGSHVTYFSKIFPNVFWHPTENDSGCLASIAAHLTLERDSGNGCTNVAEPVQLDVSKSVRHWPMEVFRFAGKFDFVFNANMVHISPWKCTLGLFSGASKMLKVGGKLMMYGPFAVDGVLEPQSNVDFDNSLKLNNPEWGVRDIVDLEIEAARENFVLHASHDVPTNNKILVWKKIWIDLWTIAERQNAIENNYCANKSFLKINIPNQCHYLTIFYQCTKFMIWKIKLNLSAKKNIK